MNHNCKCSGRYRRIWMAHPTILHFQCDKCKDERQQRKRQPARTDAQIVREAIEAIAPDSFPNDLRVGWWSALAEREDDAILAKLRRLLK